MKAKCPGMLPILIKRKLSGKFILCKKEQLCCHVLSFYPIYLLFRNIQMQQNVNLDIYNDTIIIVPCKFESQDI